MKSLNRINLAIPILLLLGPAISSSNIIVPRTTTALSASSSPASLAAITPTTISTPSGTGQLEPPSPPRSQITSAPSPEDLELGFQGRWHITTYWSCVTMGTTYTHCGWHEPVLPGGTEIAAAGRVERRGFGVLVGVFGVVGILLR